MTPLWQSRYYFQNQLWTTWYRSLQFTHLPNRFQCQSTSSSSCFHCYCVVWIFDPNTLLAGKKSDKQATDTRKACHTCNWLKPRPLLVSESLSANNSNHAGSAESIRSSLHMSNVAVHEMLRCGPLLCRPPTWSQLSAAAAGPGCAIDSDCNDNRPLASLAAESIVQSQTHTSLHICTVHCIFIINHTGKTFLADRTNGRAIGTVLRLSSLCDVMYCG